MESEYCDKLRLKHKSFLDVLKEDEMILSTNYILSSAYKPKFNPLLLQKTFETHNIRLANEKSVTNQPAHIIALHDIQIDIFYKKTQRQAFPAG